jgi:hypothetical protein
MATNMVGALVALIGLAGVLTGMSVLLTPGRFAGMFGLTVANPQAAFYARAVGIRNFATGALTLWAAYALALACLPYATAVALALSVLWAVVQGFDTVAYARVGVYRHNTVPASDGLLGRSERKLAKTARAEIA